MGETANEFNNYRARMNEVNLGKNNQVMKRLWNLDTKYLPGKCTGCKEQGDVGTGCGVAVWFSVVTTASNIIWAML
jgi:hypothetical protein